MSSSLTEGIAARIWPARLAGRISRLLALGLLLLLAICLVALRQLSLQPGSDQMADLLAAHVAALRAMPAHAAAMPHARQGLPLLEVARAAAPPATAGRPLLPFARQLVERLEEQLDAEGQVHIEEGERTWLWVGPARPGEPWLGVPMPPFRHQATQLSLIVLGCAALMVLLGSAALARMLTLPLRRLAEAAPAMVAGELPRATIGASAPAEVRELAASLQRAAADARERSRQRELMLAGLSHDLRTPLARLRYAIALAPPSEAGLHAQMEADLEELDALVGLFLDIGRGGRVRESSRPIELLDFLKTLIERSSEHEWSLYVPAELRIGAPPLALHRLVANLVRNAERHAAPPFVIRAGLDGALVWLEVIDHGPGIPPADRERVLRPFERGHAAAEGSGLGLAIAAQLAEAIGAGLALGGDGQGLQVRLHGLRPASAARIDRGG